MVASVAAFSALAGTALAQDKTAADAELMLSAFDAAETASVVSANDSVANGSEVVDSVPAAPFVPVAEPAVVSVDSSSSQPEVLSDASSAGEKPALKTVLYLSGGERSAWFHLGVLYAIEEYGIPVDSVVGTSWGAWVGSLWAKGVPLDEIQRIMKDPVIAPYVGHDLSDPTNMLGYDNRDAFELPISKKGIPSLRQRFTMTVDESLHVAREKKSLYPDTMGVKRSIAKLRFQESLYRQDVSFKIPFSVQGCDGKNEGKLSADVISSLPLWKNEISGELCPHYALPVEDNAAEFPIIVIADPLRGTLSGDSRSKLLKQMAGANLNNLPGTTIRAHTALDTSFTAMIQLGFSSVERNLSDFAPFANRRVSYKDSLASGDVRKAWFKFNPTFDSLSSETQSAVKTYWNDSDTGIVALEHFAEKILQRPGYDSLDFDMQPSGDLMVSAAVHPTFDVAVGGFGSNILGANAYFEGAVNYVNQMEIELVLSGFWGTSSYGVQPRLNVSKLWSKHWGLQFGYDYLMLRPLKTFNNEIRGEYKIVSEERSDFSMSVVYDVDANQKVSANFLFGNRTFELNPLYYGYDGVKTFPVSPSLNYEYLKGDDDPWFSQKGFAAHASAGLQSIGFNFGMSDLIPIYWKFSGDVRYAVSPKPYTTFTAGAAAAIERYHQEGHGYVSPKSFEYAPLDIAYRYHAQVTPWSTEWYDEELSSHEYALIRGSAAFHNKYFGLWLFAAYYHDFEDSPHAQLSKNKFVIEPALRLAYKSLEIYAGMNRVVDKDSFGDIADFGNYTYFVRFGNYSF